MSKRVVFLRVPSGSKVRGIYSAGTDFLVDGNPCPGTEGGGVLGSVELQGSQLVFRKVTAEGKHCRDYGTVSVRGETKQLIADGASVGAHGYTVLFVDEDDGKRGK